MTTTSLNDQTWMITGCSTGFGRELATQLLERGANVVVTARKSATISDFADKYDERALCLSLDVTSKTQIDLAVAAATKTFGKIDVLVNNAGYGYYSSVEEGDDKAIRDMFETNVFGLMAMTRAVLPVMRAQKSGTIVNISSLVGLLANPSGGYYAASKHAVEGLSEALRKEVAPLGIKVLLVNPGLFRTDFLGRSVAVTTTAIPDYEATVGARTQMLAGLDGKQIGDPVRAITAIIDTVVGGKAPTHLLLGRDTYDGVTTKLNALVAEIDAWKETTLSTDYNDVAA